MGVGIWVVVGMESMGRVRVQRFWVGLRGMGRDRVKGMGRGRVQGYG